MTLDEFETQYKNFKSHDKIEITCDGPRCIKKVFHPLKTRAKQTIQKRGCYLCQSCGQILRHINNPTSEETKKKISQGVKNYYK